VKNWGDNVFDGIPIGKDEARLFGEFVAAHDLAPNSRRAITQDVRKFARWFANANHEPWTVGRVTVRDVTDFKDFLRRDKKQAVATVNRCLVTLRRYFGWLAKEGHIAANPAKLVKELKRQQLAPKGLDRSQVRKLLREVELRADVRANAVFSLFLWTGCRVSDLANLELPDMMLGERTGTVIFRFGKGSKQRSVPLPLPARQALQAYLETRPPLDTQRVFIGERGPLTDRGVRAMCDKFSPICGFKLHPHLFRHTFAKQFLADNGNDLVSLAQLLGHNSLTTTARYSLRTQEHLSDAAEKLNY
jgi:site-specific recombinase XerD